MVAGILGARAATPVRTGFIAPPAPGAYSAKTVPKASKMGPIRQEARARSGEIAWSATGVDGFKPSLLAEGG